MPDKHRSRKARARRRARATGARYAAAASGGLHHHPLPDVDLTGLPYAAGHPVDVDLARRTIAACRAGCQPCQDSLIPRLVADRATLAALAGSVLGLLRVLGSLMSPATRAWYPLAQAAHDTGDGADCQQAVAAMTTDDATDLADDILDHWGGGGMTSDQIASLIAHLPTSGTDWTAPTDPPSSEPGVYWTSNGHDEPEEPVRVYYLDDLGIDLDQIDPHPSYQLAADAVYDTDRGPVLGLVAAAETPAAGPVHFAQATGWPRWDGRAWPVHRPDWVLRVDAASRSLASIVRLNADTGDVDETLWTAGEHIQLRDKVWDLITQAGRVLVYGSVDDGTDIDVAAALGTLRAAIVDVQITGGDQ